MPVEDLISVALGLDDQRWPGAQGAVHDAAEYKFNIVNARSETVMSC